MTSAYLIWLFVLFILLFCIKPYLLLKRVLWKRRRNVTLSVGFFHPYCNAGGGGERVLWCAIRAVQNRYDNIHCTVYTGDDVTGQSILEKAERSFNIKLPRPVDFIHLKSRTLVEAKHYPLITLLFQSLGSIVVGLEAAFKHVPDIYLDTMGYAFTYPVFKYLCSCHVGAYVHYPTISTDMLHAVSEKKVTVNNRDFISKSRFLSQFKIFYYRLFSYLYSMVGRRAQVIMVNSSWTRNHIIELWQKQNLTFRVYPPCDVSKFKTLPLKSTLNRTSLRIVSIAQFRPEKDHKLQIYAFQTFLGKLNLKQNIPTLVLIGSCRHEEDYSRVTELKSICNTIGISTYVEFKINLTFEEVLQEMKTADISLHTMWNEHFGIGIVECMSAGLIMIAHDSGGPKLDIISDKKTGFLASDISSYAAALDHVWGMKPDELLRMRRAAQESVSQFSTEEFEKSFLSSTSLLFKL